MSPSRRATAARVAAALVAWAADPTWAVQGVDGRWHPGIGDPTVMGWIVVAAYIGALVAAMMTWRLARRTAAPQTFWRFVVLAMLALGINKQLDLQSWFTEVGRDLAIEQGWHAYRRVVQGTFIGGLAICAIALIAWLRRVIEDRWADYGLTLGGLVVLMAFIVMRATSFHHVDRMLGWQVGGVRLNPVLELAGIALVAAGCLRWQRLQCRRVRQFMFRKVLHR